MPGRLSTVTRGRFIHGTDKGLKRPTERLLRGFEDAELSALAKLGKTTGTVPDGEEAHADAEFLGDIPPHAFFPPDARIPDSRGKRAILLSAYIQALRVALYANPDDAPAMRRKRAKALPVVSYWIPGVRNYEMYVALSASSKEVHVLILTPDPGKPPKTAAYGWDENMWAIATDARIEELRKLIPVGYQPPAAFAIKGAKCQKLKSY